MGRLIEQQYRQKTCSSNPLDYDVKRYYAVWINTINKITAIILLRKLWRILQQYHLYYHRPCIRVLTTPSVLLFLL